MSIFVALAVTAIATTPATGTAASHDSKAVFEAIAREREVVARERAEVDAARKDLELAEATVDQKIAQLQRIVEERQAVEKAIVAAKKVLLDARIARLVEITKKMKAEDAAVYVNALSDATAVSIIEGLPARKAALLLSRLPASKSSKLSRIYLSREPRAESSDSSKSPDGPAPTEP